MSKVRHTHTFSTLEVSRSSYDEIERLLIDAGYNHVFIDGAIDMTGIGLVRKSEEGPYRIEHDTKTGEPYTTELGIRYMNTSKTNRVVRGDYLTNDDRGLRKLTRYQKRKGKRAIAVALSPLDSEERQRFEVARERWSERCRHLTDAIDRSERITEADLAVIINTR